MSTVDNNEPSAAQDKLARIRRIIEIARLDYRETAQHDPVWCVLDDVGEVLDE